MTSPDLGEMRALYPVLGEVDDDSLSRLDSTEWFRPSAAQARQFAAIADRLGVYLMPYRANCGAVDQGLCALIAAAKLDAGGMAAIASVEMASPDIALVAYARPVRHRQ